MFDEVTRGEASMSIKNCTLVQLCPLLLLVTEMVVAPLDPDEETDDENDSQEEDEILKPDPSEKQHQKIVSPTDKAVSIVVDWWIRFEATSMNAAQLYC